MSLFIVVYVLCPRVSCRIVLPVCLIARISSRVSELRPDGPCSVRAAAHQRTRQGLQAEHPLQVRPDQGNIINVTPWYCINTVKEADYTAKRPLYLNRTGAVYQVLVLFVFLSVFLSFSFDMFCCCCCCCVFIGWFLVDLVLLFMFFAFVFSMLIFCVIFDVCVVRGVSFRCWFLRCCFLFFFSVFFDVLLFFVIFCCRWRGARGTPPPSTSSPSRSPAFFSDDVSCFFRCCCFDDVFSVFLLSVVFFFDVFHFFSWTFSSPLFFLSFFLSLQVRRYKGHPSPINFFSVKLPSTRLKQLNFASHSLAELQHLRTAMVRYAPT